MSIQIIKTSDGSDSLLNTTLNETYHSVHGAIQESQHVFIHAGLDFLSGRSEAKSINILEVGFGTGLNALLTLKHVAGLQTHIHYTTIEAFPLQEDIWQMLNYGQKLDAAEHYTTLHTCPWENWNTVTSNFNFRKIHNTLQKLELSDHYDLIFFDAFAPSKQPEMWEYPLLEKIANNMTYEGVFVTYCAKGQLKRDLKALHFEVETLEGPPGKKEMIRALKNR